MDNTSYPNHLPNCLHDESVSIKPESASCLDEVCLDIKHTLSDDVTACGLHCVSTNQKFTCPIIKTEVIGDLCDSPHTSEDTKSDSQFITTLSAETTNTIKTEITDSDFQASSHITEDFPNEPHIIAKNMNHDFDYVKTERSYCDFQTIASRSVDMKCSLKTLSPKSDETYPDCHARLDDYNPDTTTIKYEDHGSRSLDMGTADTAAGSIDGFWNSLNPTEQTGVHKFLNMMMQFVNSNTTHGNGNDQPSHLMTPQVQSGITSTPAHGNDQPSHLMTPQVQSRITSTPARLVCLINDKPGRYANVLVDPVAADDAVRSARICDVDAAYGVCLNKLVEVVFNEEELLGANGVLGKSKEGLALDSIKLEAMKEYMKVHALKYGWDIMHPKTFRKTIQNKIGNIRRKRKRASISHQGDSL